MPESEQLKIASLILRKTNRSYSINSTHLPSGGDITKLFGTYKDGAANGSDNEMIDDDLAKSYADDHEDER